MHTLCGVLMHASLAVALAGSQLDLTAVKFWTHTKFTGTLALTYVAVTGGFVYVAIILDAWSRRVVGYALSRSIDVRLTVAALRAAIERRRPAPGLTHHTDRGSQPAITSQGPRNLVRAVPR